MATTSELEALLKRVEQATGPDRELDAAITIAVLGTTATDDDLIYHRAPDKTDGCSPGTYWRISRSGMSLRTSEKLTSSLDACQALQEQMLPGLHWALGAGRARRGEPLYGMQLFLSCGLSGLTAVDPVASAEHEHAATLAWLAAILTALIAKNGEQS